MRVLAIDAAHGHPEVAALNEVRLVARRRDPPGSASGIAALASAVLADAGWRPGDLDALAASVGPGSFTGIRAGLALAQGIALVRGIPVIGVTTREAVAAALGASSPCVLWVATDARRAGRIYLETETTVTSLALTEIALPSAPILLAGDGAATLARILLEKGVDVALASGEFGAEALGRAALARARGRLAPRPAVPLYVDAPAVRFPAGHRAPS